MKAAATLALVVSLAVALPGEHWPHTTVVIETKTITQTVSACPSTSPTPPPSGPKIEVIFFSDANCQNTTPKTIYTRDVFGSVPCYNDFPDETYSSVIIRHIDDQIIGTNTALEVGVASSSDQCDFKNSVKFNVANKDLLNQCLFIGIPTGQGKPTLPGNEYRLTNLQ